MNLWIWASGFQALRTRTLTLGAEEPHGGLGELLQPPALPCWVGRWACGLVVGEKAGVVLEGQGYPEGRPALQMPWGWRQA